MSARGARMRAVDRVFVAYLAVTGVLALFGGGTGLALALARVPVAAGVVWLGRRPDPERRTLLFLRLAYPVLLTPLLYAELATLNQFFVQDTLDPLVRRWETALFGTQLAMAAGEWAESFLLSETLHVGYVSYYAMVPGALLGVYLTRGPEALHRVAVATSLAFFSSYVVFILFPVAGPRYDFPRIDGPRSLGRAYDLVHLVLEGGSSRGTAFPSSHVAASGAAVLGAGREDARWLWLLFLPWLALTVGTVYGRFHYGVDALAGALLAVVAVPVARRLAPPGGPGQATPPAGRVSNG